MLLILSEWADRTIDDVYHRGMDCRRCAYGVVVMLPVLYVLRGPAWRVAWVHLTHDLKDLWEVIRVGPRWVPVLPQDKETW